MRAHALKRITGLVATLVLLLGTALVASPAAAEAKASTVWDRVARCESSGRWHINTGNGYYGGLQFSRSTWKAFGGRRYAATANKATRAEQITVAKRVLKRQGPRAWPHCSRVAHLTRKNGAAVKVRL